MLGVASEGTHAPGKHRSSPPCCAVAFASSRRSPPRRRRPLPPPLLLQPSCCCADVDPAAASPAPLLPDFRSPRRQRRRRQRREPSRARVRAVCLAVLAFLLCFTSFRDDSFAFSLSCPRPVTLRRTQSMPFFSHSRTNPQLTRLFPPLFDNRTAYLARNLGKFSRSHSRYFFLFLCWPLLPHTR